MQLLCDIKWKIISIYPDIYIYTHTYMLHLYISLDFFLYNINITVKEMSFSIINSLYSKQLSNTDTLTLCRCIRDIDYRQFMALTSKKLDKVQKDTIMYNRLLWNEEQGKQTVSTNVPRLISSKFSFLLLSIMTLFINLIKLLQSLVIACLSFFYLGYPPPNVHQQTKAIQLYKTYMLIRISSKYHHK